MASRNPGIASETNLFTLGGPLHFSAAEYASALLAHGTSGEWRRAIICPCARPDSRTARIDCKTCKGVGYAYPTKMRCPIYFLDVTRSMTQKYGQVGSMTSGSMAITLPPGFVPAQGDMFLPDGEEHVVQQRLWRNATQRTANSQILRAHMVDRQVPASAPPRRERLLYPEANCIEAVAYMDAEDRLVLADEKAYHIDEDGYFTWRDDEGPQPGASWTVRYHSQAAYVVQGSSPVFRHENGVNMPWRATVQRLDRMAEDDQR